MDPKFEEHEEITRPDLPGTIAAPKCLDCGRVYGDHVQTAKPVDATVKCGGIRKNFRPGMVPGGDGR